MSIAKLQLVGSSAPDPSRAYWERVWGEFQADWASPEARARVLTVAYRSYRDQLLILARRKLRYPSEADEVVQEAFIAFDRRLSECGGQQFFKDDLRSWLRRTARNVCKNSNRSQRRREAARQRLTNQGGRALPAPLAEAGQLDALDQPKRHCAIELFLAEFDDEHREIIRLRVEGKTYEEIAAHIGRSTATVKRRLTRFRDVARRRAVHDPLFQEMLQEIADA